MTFFSAHAQPVPVSVLSAGVTPQQNIPDHIDPRTRLSGNWGGMRNRLLAWGIDIRISDTNELWSTPVGGAQASSNYIGSTAVEMVTDLHVLTGLPLGTFDISAMEIRGRPFSNTPLYVFNQTSNIEADDNGRLYELWYSQKFMGERLAFRIGKLDLGHDFMVSSVGLNFLNASFSWPIMPDNDLYDQGPVSPVATPAIRLRYTLSPHWNFLFAAADDNPVGGPFINAKDPWNQNRDPGGTRFSFSTGALFFGEVQYRRTLYGRQGTYKLGGYLDTGRFPDQSDFNKSHETNWAIYGIADQTLQHFGRITELDAFVRGNWTAETDRNQIVYAVDGGFALKGAFGRADDVLGLGAGLGAASPCLAWADRRAGLPGQGTEYHFELTYQAQVTPWMIIQPDIQGIVAPSGGVRDSKGERVRNEATFGLHGNVTF
ncbi:carbohydrate porin [Komagataeibacter sp. AV436]|uniref:Carbohydrate porin n=1 Tax=Komagataeibacter melomenusus TaxID=2766578 RepID=A0ABX2ABT2_9PROT|nr:carbohydrate porin [Komagataeibacter melomenusus]NPC65304.1 carbohydrate porin [Komagataeibacter melomenusus]